MSWYIEDARGWWPWLTDEEIIERLDVMGASGKLVEATEEEIERINAGKWMRVGTNVICDICGKEYVDHPVLDYDSLLHRLCNGTLGKT